MLEDEDSYNGESLSNVETVHVKRLRCFPYVILHVCESHNKQVTAMCAGPACTACCA